jgi:hypothetical protein
MDDATTVHVFNTFTDLSNETLAGLFREDEIFTDDAVKKLPAINSAIKSCSRYFNIIQC